jgi:glycosyltransferase involved in cell wall biosynthesis
MRIVLDLGTSWLWTRPPVGIVRTEQKFARYLFESSELPVAFCRFDKALQCHVEIEPERARALVYPQVVDDIRDPADPPVDASTDTATVAERARAPIVPRAPLGQRIVASLKRGGHAFVQRVPEPLRPDAVNTLRAGFHFARGTSQLARNWIRAARARKRRALTSGGPLSDPTPAKISEAFRFEPADVYLSMGLDWEHNSIQSVYRERRRVGFRTVLFCYDTIPVRFPHLMSFDARQTFARYFVDLAHAADQVVAISQTSRRDFLSLMDDTGGPKPPVDVVLLGTDLDVAEGSVRAPSEDLESAPFVLCVSTIEARKNHEVIYNAWDRLVEKYGDEVPRLVIVGMVGWGVGDLLFKMRTNPRVRNRILILDNLADGELAWLYRHSLFTVFPSLYEGWGLPVVESLAQGKPCICSTASAVAEAAQGLAMVVDPLDTPRWVAAIEQLWRDDDLRDQAAARCAREFRPQLWKDHARQLLEVALRGTTP